MKKKLSDPLMDLMKQLMGSPYIVEKLYQEHTKIKNEVLAAFNINKAVK